MKVFFTALLILWHSGAAESVLDRHLRSNLQKKATGCEIGPTHMVVSEALALNIPVRPCGKATPLPVKPTIAMAAEDLYPAKIATQGIGLKLVKMASPDVENEQVAVEKEISPRVTRAATKIAFVDSLGKKEISSSDAEIAGVSQVVEDPKLKSALKGVAPEVVDAKNEPDADGKFSVTSATANRAARIAVDPKLKSDLKGIVPEETAAKAEPEYDADGNIEVSTARASQS